MSPTVSSTCNVLLGVLQNKRCDLRVGVDTSSLRRRLCLGVARASIFAWLSIEAEHEARRVGLMYCSSLFLASVDALRMLRLGVTLTSFCAFEKRRDDRLGMGV